MVRRTTKRKAIPKPKYTSKAYRRYHQWWSYTTLGILMAEQILGSEIQRHGFAARFLGRVSNELRPKPDPSIKLEPPALIPYSRHRLVYEVPAGWKPFGS